MSQNSIRDRHANAIAANGGQCGDFTVGVSQPTLGGAMRHNDQSRNAGFVVNVVGFILTHTADADVIPPQDVGNVRQHMRTVGDCQTQIVAATEFFLGLKQNRCLTPASSGSIET